MFQPTSPALSTPKVRDAASLAGFMATLFAVLLLVGACAADGAGDGGDTRAQSKYDNSDPYGGVYGSRRRSGFQPH